MITLAWPWILLLLPAPWVIRRLLPHGNPPVSESALRVPFFDDLPQIQSGRSIQKSPRHLTFWLGFGLWCLLLIAAARPQWVGEPIALPVTGRDLMLAVDVSGSMEIPDFSLHGEEVNRLEVVKEVAGQFVKRRTGDRVGLILFGSQAYLQTPLTFDRQTVQTMLEESEIGLAGKETAIGDALGLAVKRFRRHPQEHKVLLLLTDGANTAGQVGPVQAAKLASSQGIRIYAIGVGADSMEVPTLLGSRMVNPSRDLDEATLQTIADLTGGIYFRARDTQGLHKIYEEVDRLEPTIRDTEYFRPVKELYVWPLGTAFFMSLLIAWWLVNGMEIVQKPSLRPHSTAEPFPHQ